MFAGKVHNLRHFGFRHLVGVNTAFTDAVLMHVHHNSVGGRMVLVEEALEHMDHEFHRRVVIVQEQHPVETRPFALRLGLGDDCRARRAAPSVVVLPRKSWCDRSAGGVCDFLNRSLGHW